MDEFVHPRRLSNVVLASVIDSIILSFDEVLRILRRPCLYCLNTVGSLSYARLFFAIDSAGCPERSHPHDQVLYSFQKLYKDDPKTSGEALVFSNRTLLLTVESGRVQDGYMGVYSLVRRHCRRPTSDL